MTPDTRTCLTALTIVLAVVFSLLVAIGVVASYGLTRRAPHVDPIVALRR